MSADYVRDPEGTVHVMSPVGDHEFTFCGRQTSEPDSGGFVGVAAAGPADCPECREAVLAMRDAIKGIRWRVWPGADPGTPAGRRE